jgi:hypothetical protein
MNLHIKSVEELTKFLKVLQEGEDPYKTAFELAYNEDKETYNLGKGKKTQEQNEEEDPNAEQDPPEEEPEESEPQSNSEDKRPSLDALIRNINNLRSGQSLKSADVRNEVADYYDSLSEEDQKVLVLFMRNLADVITQKQTGDEAEKPKADDKEEEAGEETEPDEQPKKEPESSEVPLDPAQGDAPIRVDEAQDFSSVKNIYNRLRG